MSENWIIPLYKIYSDDEDLSLVTKIIKRGSHWAIGPEIEEFEDLLKQYVGSDYCISLNSGTSSLHALLLAYGIHDDDEVIVPSFSFISTANSVLFVNASPIFADIESERFGLDPNSVRSNLSSKTKAVIPMDYAGYPCKINEIKQLTQDNNLILIEDAAESLGSSTNGKKIGSISDSTVFSFCGNKVITTGEGGAIVTNSKDIYEKIKLIRSHGRLDSVSYFDNPNNSDYVGIGYNWRMSSITAALGISQLQKLDKIIKLRQDHAKYISASLSKIPEISVPHLDSQDEHIFQMYTIRLNSKHQRDELHKYLLNKKIFSKIYFSPIHLTPYYMQKFKTYAGMLPNTETISDQVLTLPLYPNMTTEEKMYLLNSIHEYFENI